RGSAGSEAGGRLSRPGPQKARPKLGLAPLFPAFSWALAPATSSPMDRIRIRGGKPLKGEIPISGAKNAALKLMAASLLTAEPLTLANVPRLADVRAMAELLMTFGVTIQVNMSPNLGEGDTMRLQAGQITSAFASYDMVRKMRASFQVLAPLVARRGEAKV